MTISEKTAKLLKAGETFLYWVLLVLIPGNLILAWMEPDFFIRPWSSLYFTAMVISLLAWILVRAKLRSRNTHG